MDKAADQFEAVVARFPDHVEARQELRDVYKEKGQTRRRRPSSAWPWRRSTGSRATRPAAAQARGGGRGARAPRPRPRPRRPAAPAPAPPPSRRPRRRARWPPLDRSRATEPERRPKRRSPLEVEEGGLEAPDGAGRGRAVPSTSSEPAAGAELSGGFLDEEAGRRRTSCDLEPMPAPSRGTLDRSSRSSRSSPRRRRRPAPARRPQRRGPPPRPRPSPARAAPVAHPAPARRRPPRRRRRPAAPRRPSRRAPPPAAAGACPPELQRALDEVEQYVSLGFVDDAKDALREISLRYPGPPGDRRQAWPSWASTSEARRAARLRPPQPPRRAEPALVRREREPATLEPPTSSTSPRAGSPSRARRGARRRPFAELRLWPSPASRSPSRRAGGPSRSAPSLELARGLGEPDSTDERRVLGRASTSGPSSATCSGPSRRCRGRPPEPAATDLGDAGLADIFKEFKKGVDKQLGKEDYDTRYNLGIAYKEMGLVDEAIAEFQLAAKDENRLLECSSMLGICFLEKGMPKLAVKWFEKGLTAPGRTDEEYQGLRYDLAMAHEAAGETDRRPQPLHRSLRPGRQLPRRGHARSGS